MKLHTIDDALQEVADRSFYEGVAIYPVIDPRDSTSVLGYVLEDDSERLSHDNVSWTREEGVKRGPETDWSELMDPSQNFTSAEHIRRNLSRAVRDLENGKTVTFAYSVVTDEDAPLSEDDIENDDIVGWVLLAQAHD